MFSLQIKPNHKALSATQIVSIRRPNLSHEPPLFPRVSTLQLWTPHSPRRTLSLQVSRTPAPGYQMEAGRCHGAGPSFLALIGANAANKLSNSVTNVATDICVFLMDS